MATSTTFDDFKQLGNDCFVKGEYEKAIHFYSKALSIQPENHLALSNRSACYLKLGKHEDAYTDAANCVSLAPKFARGHLRKASALNGMKRFKEAMASAENGFRLRGSDKISKDCISEWLKASEVNMEEGMAKLEESIPGVRPPTEKCLVVLLQLEQLNDSTGVSIKDLFSLLDMIADEVNALLQRFGHKLSPCLNLWISALRQALKIDPRTHFAPPSAIENMTKHLHEFISWLDTDVDHLLYPIMRPVFGMLVLCILCCATTLSQAISFRSSIKLLSNVSLVFFRDSILSTPSEYNRLYIYALQTLLNSYCMPVGHGFRKETEKEKERSQVKDLVTEFKSVLEKYSTSNADYAEVMKTATLVIENAMQLISPIGDGQNSESERLTSSDSNFLKKEVAQEFEKLNNMQDLNFRDMDTLVLYTGGLVHLKEIDCAKSVLKKSEECYLAVLMKLLERKLLKIDDIAECIVHPQMMMISNALHFAGVDDSLFANVVITWKSLATELYALFAKLGVKNGLLNMFNRVMMLKLGEGIKEDSLVEVTDQYYSEVEKIVEKWSVKTIEELFKHSWEKIQSKLSSNQMLLQYCMCPLYDTDCYPVPIPPKVIHLSGVLVAISDHGEPVVKVLDFRKIQNLCVETHDKSMKVVAAKLAGKEWKNLQIEADRIGSDLLETILPSDLQTTLLQDKIECIYFCPDQLLSKLPIEILQFKDGKRLGEKFAISYLSSAREILRESTCQTLQSTFNSSEQFSNKCVIFGNPNFDLQKDEHQISSTSHWSSLGSILSSFFSSAADNTSKAQPLPLSENEADEIEYLLSSAKVDEKICHIEKFVGDNAHLGNALRVHSPYILHFATHGFSSPDFHYQYRNFWTDTKSGILLAGANTYRLQNYSAIVDDAGTGELSALAVCGLNLTGTHLVYLSTCRSSYGLMGRGESLSSLAQGFRIAGSKTVIATLWPTPDDIARKIAIHFYSFLKQGMRPSLALMAAKRTLSEEDEYSHWYNWAGFLCIGVDNPLFV